MNWLRNVIRDFHAPSLEERLRQVNFFMDAISQASDLDPHSALFCDVQAVVERYIKHKVPGNGAHEAEVQATNGGNGAELIRDPERCADTVASIERTDLRISAFDRGFRYTYTSPANGQFYGIPQRDFTGRHVTEMIGEDRFEKRAKAYFEKCLDGEDQCYYYYLDSAERGRQLLECRMLRQYNANDEALGALIVMRDLTGGFADPVKSAEANRI
jgi:PAS domain S-box-containing protein